MIQQTILKLKLIVIIRIILTLILILQSTFDANDERILFQIFMNLTKEVFHQKLLIMLEIKNV
jgi:hypothetical protein